MYYCMYTFVIVYVLPHRASYTRHEHDSWLSGQLCIYYWVNSTINPPLKLMIYDITIVLTAPIKVQVGVGPRLTEAALEYGINAECDSI